MQVTHAEDEFGLPDRIVSADRSLLVGGGQGFLEMCAALGLLPASDDDDDWAAWDPLEITYNTEVGAQRGGGAW